MKKKHSANSLTRRDMLKRTVFATAATVVASPVTSYFAPLVNRGRYRISAASSVEYSARAIELVKRSTVIDMLSPLTLNFPKQAKWFAD
ncbi:MAG: hypothetical protein L0220_05150, partial [Acidobacteria bacterium]|nr:hypothetical protein [Acidobacteriota bacterium]